MALRRAQQADCVLEPGPEIADGVATSTQRSCPPSPRCPSRIVAPTAPAPSTTTQSRSTFQRLTMGSTCTCPTLSATSARAATWSSTTLCRLIRRSRRRQVPPDLQPHRSRRQPRQLLHCRLHRRLPHQHLQRPLRDPAVVVRCSRRVPGAGRGPGVDHLAGGAGRST